VTWCQAVNSQDHQTPDWWSRPRCGLHSNTASLFINDGARNHVCSGDCTFQKSNSGTCYLAQSTLVSTIQKTTHWNPVSYLQSSVSSPWNVIFSFLCCCS